MQIQVDVKVQIHTQFLLFSFFYILLFLFFIYCLFSYFLFMYSSHFLFIIYFLIFCSLFFVFYLIIFHFFHFLFFYIPDSQSKVSEYECLGMECEYRRIFLVFIIIFFLDHNYFSLFDYFLSFIFFFYILFAAT